MASFESAPKMSSMRRWIFSCCTAWNADIACWSPTCSRMFIDSCSSSATARVMMELMSSHMTAVFLVHALKPSKSAWDSGATLLNKKGWSNNRLYAPSLNVTPVASHTRYKSGKNCSMHHRLLFHAVCWKK